MALVLKDRVRETSTTTGTGTFTLAGAVAGFQSFSAIGTGNSTYYTIVSTSDWEVGIGIWTSPNQLSRNTVLASTNAGALVTFGSGTKDVFLTFPAEGFAVPPDIGGTTPNTITGTTITGNQVISYGRFTVDDTAFSGYTADLAVDANGYAIIGGSSLVGGPIDQPILAPAGLALGDSNTAIVLLSAAPTSTYGLNFPPAAGSNNQLLKTDGAGNLGWMDLGSPPVIGGTTPNTITGTTVSATTQMLLPTVTVGNVGTGVLQMVDGLDGYDYLHISSDDGSGTPQSVYFDDSVVAAGGITGVSITGTQYIVNGDGVNSGAVRIAEESNTSSVILTVPTTLATNYNFVLPTTAGSANQVLKTDGSGNLSWTTVDPLTLTGINDPTAPSNTNTTIYSKSFGGYATLAARNALNTSFGLQSALWSKNIQMWTTTAATAGSWLNASGTGNGTYTNVNPTTGGTLYQTVRRSTYANVITTANQTLGIINGQASFFRGNAAGQGGYFFYARCGFDVWTNGGRFFAGLSQGATVVTANATGTNNTAGFAVEDTDAGAISFVTRSGTASTKTAVGLTITSNKGYDCYIYCSPNDTKITWQIIDINTGTSVTGTANTNLPVNTTMINPLVLASNAALTPATSISIGVAKIYVESDY